jgi:hypothetical protein
MTPEPEAPKKVVSLRGVTPQIPTVDQDVVTELENALAEARDGQVVGVALTIIRFNHDIVTGWAGTPPSIIMIGAAARLLHHLHLMEDGNQEDEC